MVCARHSPESSAGHSAALQIKRRIICGNPDLAERIVEADSMGREYHDEAEQGLLETRNGMRDSQKTKSGIGFRRAVDSEPLAAHYELMGLVEFVAGAVEMERAKVDSGTIDQLGSISATGTLLSAA